MASSHSQISKGLCTLMPYLHVRPQCCKAAVLLDLSSGCILPADRVREVTTDLCDQPNRHFQTSSSLPLHQSVLWTIPFSLDFCDPLVSTFFTNFFFLSPLQTFFCSTRPLAAVLHSSSSSFLSCAFVSFFLSLSIVFLSVVL